MKSNKKRVYPEFSRLECRKRRAQKHDKQVMQEQQLIREVKQENTHAWQ